MRPGPLTLASVRPACRLPPCRRPSPTTAPPASRTRSTTPGAPRTPLAAPHPPGAATARTTTGELSGAVRSPACELCGLECRATPTRPARAAPTAGLRASVSRASRRRRASPAAGTPATMARATTGPRRRPRARTRPLDLPSTATWVAAESTAGGPAGIDSSVDSVAAWIPSPPAPPACLPTQPALFDSALLDPAQALAKAIMFYEAQRRCGADLEPPGLPHECMPLDLYLPAACGPGSMHPSEHGPPAITQRATLPTHSLPLPQRRAAAGSASALARQLAAVRPGGGRVSTSYVRCCACWAARCAAPRGGGGGGGQARASRACEWPVSAAGVPGRLLSGT